MSNLWKLVAVAIGAVLVACQWPPPQSGALEEARRALKLARSDPLVAQAAPGELHDAQIALHRAERSWIETHDDATTGHLAYVAFQRVAIARNAGLQREAEQRLQRARLEGENLLATQSARDAPVDAGAHPLPVTLIPAPAAEPGKAPSPGATPQPAVDAPTPTAAEDAKGDEPARPAAAPVRAKRTSPATLAPAKPSLPIQLQARGSPGPKRVVSARHERKAGAMQGARHVAQRVPRKGSAAKAAPEPERRVAASKPEVWYIEAQGRPSLAPLPVPASPTKTASVAELELRHARQQRRMQALYGGGHGQPE
jgi:hypothetical protein